ncbi:YraN family protein [bacterium]|nr:YraN family protein [bacterium]
MRLPRALFGRSFCEDACFPVAQVEEGSFPWTEVGPWGEAYAAAQLQREGYVIIDRNWRVRDGELDIVCHRGTTLAFVEVKTRRTGSPYFPMNEWVNDEKEERLYRLGALYRRRSRQKLRRFHYIRCRFDLFSIVTGDAISKDPSQRSTSPLRSHHYEDAFKAHW